MNGLSDVLKVEITVSGGVVQEVKTTSPAIVRIVDEDAGLTGDWMDSSPWGASS